MKAGIIQIGSTNYYIDLNKSKGKVIFEITYYKDGREHTLSKEELSSVFHEMFSTQNLTFLGKENDYEVFIDDNENKRYFKNKKEDYQVFFENNGSNAIMYAKGFSGAVEGTKRYFFKVKGKIVVLIATALMASFLTSCCLTPEQPIMASDNEPVAVAFATEKAEETKKPQKKVTADYLIDWIQREAQTSGKEVSPAPQEMKDFMCNKAMFTDILKLLNEDEKENLRKKFWFFEIHYATGSEKEEMIANNWLGYYNSTERNRIVVLEFEDNSYFYNTIAHELVHVFQANQYYYIQEALAEIMSCEYFDYEITSYKPQIQRVQTLMEIIGPELVMQAAFKNEPTEFEKEIKDCFGEENLGDALHLLGLFRTDATNFSEEIDNEIDSLLAKMYEKKFGSSIGNDPMISYIYKNGPVEHKKRSYFNHRNDGYSRGFFRHWPRIINPAEVEQFVWYVDEDVLQTKEGVRVPNSLIAKYYYDDSRGIIYNIDSPSETYSLEEAKEKGIIKVYRERSGTYEDLVRDVKLYKVDNIKYETVYMRYVGEENTNLRQVDNMGLIIVSDDSITIEGYGSSNTIVPSIEEKFPSRGEKRGEEIKFEAQTGVYRR